MKKTTKTDKRETLEGLAKELLSLMGTKAKVAVSEDKENEALAVDIDAGDETGLLIGRHGETLSSLQSLLGMMLRQHLGEWSRIVVNVGDWREKQEERLEELATQAAGRAVETGEAQPLYNLTASQRRIVHLYLSKNTDVETESQGEGEERFLVVKPKKK